MAEKEKGRRKKPAAAEKAKGDLFPLVRRVLLAGVGAAALAYDEASAFVDRLVERGELAHDQARDLLKEVSERREGRLHDMGGQVRERLSRALETLDVPRRTDLAALQQRLDKLSERVETLLKQKEGQG
jgi:polyhydroxyalkanoate synthesis regulator phasin